MDITVNNKKLFSNKFINGETVNYALSAALSFFILIIFKQFFKTFIGISTDISCTIAFLCAEVFLFLSEKFLVYKNNALSGTAKQIILSVINAGVHFGFYKIFTLIMCKILGSYDFTAWFTSFIFISILNYPVSRIIIFDCLGSAESKKNGRIFKLFFRNRFVILSMLIALLGILFIYSVFTVFPFGDTTVLRMDLYHQYGPLFVELFDRVTEHKSFLYSWTSGGGSSFLGNYFNYLSSPLTALIFLFDRIQMPYAISFLVALKCILSAGCFAFYLKKSQKSHSGISAAFGVLYAFSAYFLAYFWNIMWLDGMIMLPLIILGIENIINKGSCKLYIISLIILFYASYYMGYMTCIFSVIYFFAYFAIAADSGNKIDKNLVSSKKFSFKNLWNNKFLNRGFKFAVSSLFAGAVCAIFLIPVFFILSECSATSGTFPKTFESYFTLFDFIENHFANLETTIRSSGNDVLPNIYCGVICLILVPLFVINKEISFKEKAVYIALLIFFLFSFNNNCANYIWHAFHFPNDLPYRFSYMYSFIILIISFKAFKHIKAIGIKEIGIIAMIWGAVIAIAQEMLTEKMSESTIYITIAFLIIWTAVLFLVKKETIGKAVIYTLILAVTFCEVIVSDTKAFNLSQKQSDYVQNYDTYVEASDYIEENDDSFYRTELCSLNTRMDPCLYGYDGISTFSSMAYEAYSGVQYSLGMYGNRINSYTYNTQTPVYNMMYGIKYLTYLEEDTRPSTELYTKCYETSDGKAAVFKNDYYLPISFCVNQNTGLWDTEEGNPFRVQGELFNLATGYSNVFTEALFTNCEYTGLTGDTITESGNYWVSGTGDSNYGTADITLTAAISGNIYIYVTSTDAKSITCQTPSGTVNQQIETPYILDLGYAEAGNEYTVSIDFSDSDDGESSFEIYAYSVNSNILNAGYRKLSDAALQITESSDTKISGTVTAYENCILYSSIPYDKGWSVYVDGEKAETFEIGGCQLGTALKPGEHKIEYRYRPRGIAEGAAISAAAAAAFIAFYFLKKKKSQKTFSDIYSSDNAK